MKFTNTQLSDKVGRFQQKTFVEVFKNDLRFDQFENDICLMHREDDFGTVIMAIYVDDCLMIGDEKAVTHAFEEIQKHFEITHSTEIDEFIGCTIERDKKRIFLSQPDLIKKLMEKFGDDVMKMKEFETPASQGSHVMRPISEEEKLTEEEQKIY